MVLGIPPLIFNIMLEPNPLKPTMLVGRLGVGEAATADALRVSSGAACSAGWVPVRSIGLGSIERSGSHAYQGRSRINRLIVYIYIYIYTYIYIYIFIIIIIIIIIISIIIIIIIRTIVIYLLLLLLLLLYGSRLQPSPPA